jgi:hypothetical protein
MAISGVLDALGMVVTHRTARIRHETADDWATDLIPVRIRVPG